MATRKRGNEVTIVSGAQPLLEVQNLQIAYEKKGMLEREEPAPAVMRKQALIGLSASTPTHAGTRLLV